ncbi:NAD(P)/FAD-dependent oxidoreductase [Portibacter marinus]|uniref:NAD(P)/FAD-dependent oxidoreductase n=1 Tax=Portibacter marinus TaxID=2898660 RepID=UPI001F19461E|nr:FAD-dependent oxidoreductase [Portibacter marinus]
MLDVLVVGQGIAGSLIALQCIKRNLSFYVIDAPEKSRASKVAAGIINPITGRKYVKTWMYEELQKEFVSMYRWTEDLLSGEYLNEREIYRTIPTVKDQNQWDARLLEKGASPFMQTAEDAGDFEGKLFDRQGFGLVNGYQLRMDQLIKDLRKYLEERKYYSSEIFDHASLEINEKAVRYKKWITAHVIFCEGHAVSQNPFFNELPFAPAKGELLLVRIPNFQTDHILKDQLFFVPLERDIFWVGASYAWDEFSDQPTGEKEKWLIEGIEKVLNVPYEIIDHKAGIRPATKYRKPFIGSHSAYPSLHLFNGLGTKGASLGPYFAKALMASVFDQKTLHPEVDIQRFDNVL